MVRFPPHTHNAVYVKARICSRLTITRHAWISYMVDSPPPADKILQAGHRSWELPEHRPNLTASRAAFKTYSTYVCPGRVVDRFWEIDIISTNFSTIAPAPNTLPGPLSQLRGKRDWSVSCTSKIECSLLTSFFLVSISLLSKHRNRACVSDVHNVALSTGSISRSISSLHIVFSSSSTFSRWTLHHTFNI